MEGVKKRKMNKWITDMICGLLVLLFVYTAFSKLFDYTQFRRQLSSSPVFSSYAGIIAWLVPAIELVIAGMLIVNTTRLLGLYASMILLFIFTVYIGAMLLTAEHLPCSCGGVIEQLTWQQHLVFNTAFMALCGWGIVMEQRNNKDLMKLQIE